MQQSEHELTVELPVGSVGHHAQGWWGLLTLIATEGALIGYLLFTYAYLNARSPGAWPPDGPPLLKYALINTGVLLTSTIFVWGSERMMRSGRRWLPVLALAVALMLSCAFVWSQAWEWLGKSFTHPAMTYASVYFVITAVHLAHLIVGMVVLASLLVWIALGYMSAERHGQVTIGAVYWYFVNVVWLSVFFTIYISPYLEY